MARGELHIQLSVHYADDEKFDEVSRSARLLYVDACCAAKKLLNDGRFSRAKLRKLMAPESATRADRALAELVDAGLLVRDDAAQMFVIGAWLKRNKSRSQIERDRREAEESSLRANHKRWHIETGERNPKCRLCADEPSGSGSATGSGAGVRPGATETETETETDGADPQADPAEPPRPPARRAAPPAEPEGDPGRAEQLVRTWMLGCNRRPPGRVVDDVGRLVAEMIRDGTDTADIERGLHLWQARGSNPKTLPSFVNQVMNSRPSNVVAFSAGRPSTTDQRVADALAVGAHLQAEADRKAIER